jgi:hypothetical protein
MSLPASHRDGTEQPFTVKRFVPDLVTMFSAGPEVQPNSEENAFESTVDFLIAPSGTVAIAV